MCVRDTCARKPVDIYLVGGILMTEARTSMNLGHGDGHGRWVKVIFL